MLFPIVGCANQRFRRRAASRDQGGAIDNTLDIIRTSWVKWAGLRVEGGLFFKLR